MSALERSHADDDQISLRDVIAFARSSWKIVALSVFLFAGLAVSLALILTPTYRAKVVMVVQDKNTGGMSAGGNLAALASLAGVGGGALTNRGEAIAFLQANTLTLQFIEARKLLPILTKGVELDESIEPAYRTRELLQIAARRFDRSIRKVDDDRTTGTITLSIDWRDRNLAADWANWYVDFVNEAARARAAADADRRLVYLRRELDNTDIVPMQLSLNKLIEQELQRKMLAATDQEYMFRIVDRATVPDLKNFIKPDRLLIAAIGVVFGMGFGLLLALARNALRSDGKPAAGR